MTKLEQAARQMMDALEMQIHDAGSIIHSKLAWQAGHDALAEQTEQPIAENKAVRCFLMQYGTPGLTIGAMRNHMKRCGYREWPALIGEEAETCHLTKSDAQLWIRHLFSTYDTYAAIVAAHEREKQVVEHAAAPDGYWSDNEFVDVPEEQEPVCKRCNGTKIVPDGKMYSVDGFQLEVPIECVKDCPDCTAPVRTKDLTDDEIAEIVTELDSKLIMRDATELEIARAVIAADREKNK